MSGLGTQPLGTSPLGSGGVVDSGCGQAPFGTRVLKLTPDPALPRLEFSFPLLGPPEPTMGMISFYSGVDTWPLHVVVSDASGNQVSAADAEVLCSGDWGRVAVSSEIGPGYMVTVSHPTPPGPVYFDGFLIEPGANVGGFFDGTTVAGGSPAIRYRFEGNSPMGASIAELVPDPMSMRSSPIEGTPSSVVLSLLARADHEHAQLTAELISSVTGEVIGSSVISVGTEWGEWSLLFPSGSSVYVLFSSTFKVDIDQVMLEGGDTVRTYFDYNSPAQGDYAAFRDPVTGVSYWRYDNPMLVTRADDKWRPYLSIVEGSLQQAPLLAEWETLESVDQAILPYERHYNGVSATSGPTPTSTYAMRTGAMMKVEFGLTTEVPFAYGTTREVVDSIVGDFPSGHLIEADLDCTVLTPSPILPDGPIPAPPRPPDVLNTSAPAAVDAYQRFYVDIPEDRVASSASMVPVLALTSSVTDVRDVRVRFHPNPFNYPAQSVDPCSFCSEFIITLIPAATELIIDGEVEHATAVRAAMPDVTADNLLYGSGGVPIVWPELSCGVGYVMTVDIPSTQYDADPAAAGANLHVNLSLTRRE